MTDPYSTQPPPDNELIRQLVERCLELMDNEGEAAVDAFLEKHQEHAALVKKRASSLVRAGLLGPSRDMPDSIGEFKLIKQIGQGGMGAVYLAEEQSLDRRVALKVIQPEDLERFSREVQAMSRLAHPAIVPMYGVGEAEGVPYLAMDFVEGATLAELLALQNKAPNRLSGADLAEALQARLEGAPKLDGPGAPAFERSWVRVCFDLMAQVADAVQHAHDAGVLHRDIKPSNIMLTADGRPMLMDFCPMPRSGSPGSLPYMAPEQVKGRVTAIDRCTDVYGLGVTLFELLTLRPPFGRGDDLRSRILAGKYERFDKLNRAVSRDAQTICLTAIDVDPRRRYPSAAAFAEDLRSHLDLLPIKARRRGSILRVLRPVGGKPALVTALVAFAVVAVGGPTVFAIERSAASAELRETLDQRDAQHRRAERQLTSAIDAIDKILATDLAGQPALDATRQRLLARALSFYEQLLAEEGVDGEVRVTNARAQIGRIQHALGDRGAEANLREAVTRFRAARAADPTDRRLVLTSVRAELSLAALLSDTSRLREVDDTLASAMTAFEALPELDRELSELRGEVLERRAATAMSRGWVAAGVDYYRELLELRTALDDASADAAMRIAEAELGLGIALTEVGDRANAKHHLDVALARHRDIATREPTPESRFKLALVHQALANLAHDRSDLDGAADSAHRAIAILEVLTADLPEIARYRRKLVESVFRLGVVARSKLDFEAAERHYRRALGHADVLLAASPGSTRALVDRGRLLNALAIVLDRKGDRPRAAENFAAAHAALRLAVDAAPGDVRGIIELSESLRSAATFESRLGDPDRALQLVAEAVAHLARLDGEPQLQVHLRSSLLVKADLLVRRGSYSEAVTTLSAAVDAGATRANVDQARYRDALGGRDDFRALVRRVAR